MISTESGIDGMLPPNTMMWNLFHVALYEERGPFDVLACRSSISSPTSCWMPWS